MAKKTPVNAEKIKRETDRVSHFFRGVVRTLNWLANSASIINTMSWVLYLSIAVNLVDGFIKTNIELSSGHAGALFAFKLFVALTCVGAAIASIVFLAYTPLFNLLTMFLGALSKGVDAAIDFAYDRNTEAFEKGHDFLIATAIFISAALMLTVAPIIGETLLLCSTYYFVLDLFGFNPLRSSKNTADDMDSPPSSPTSLPRSEQSKVHPLKQLRMEKRTYQYHNVTFFQPVGDDEVEDKKAHNPLPRAMLLKQPSVRLKINF